LGDPRIRIVTGVVFAFVLVAFVFALALCAVHEANPVAFPMYTPIDWAVVSQGLPDALFSITELPERGGALAFAISWAVSTSLLVFPLPSLPRVALPSLFAVQAIAFFLLLGGIFGLVSLAGTLFGSQLDGEWLVEQWPLREVFGVWAVALSGAAIASFRTGRLTRHWS
jgi:hypothetical protein